MKMPNYTCSRVLGSNRSSYSRYIASNTKPWWAHH